MKKILYILAVCLLVFSACSDDSFRQETDTDGTDRVLMHFTLEDMPDFQVATKAGSETQVGNLSLLTFDIAGNFLGRVVASDIQQTENPKGGTAIGTGSVSVPKETKYIHFVANYAWAGSEYLIPAGETEQVLMPSLATSDRYVAWGRATVSDFKQVSVQLLRNYAKVTVTSELSDKNKFEVAGFALANYVNKGTVATYGERDRSFENVTGNTDADTKITQVSNYSDCMGNQTKTDCLNTNAKYMFEYMNNYDSQTSVIIKKKNAEQYYKIQLLDAEGNPFVIERNYEYQVIIKLFVEDAIGSATFEEALKAAPTNNIFAEITKEAPTVSDSEGNRLTVTPLFLLFTSSGSCTFDANYWAGGTSKSNGDILVSLIQNGHEGRAILSNLSYNASTAKATANVTVAGASALDSATVLIRVKGKMLSRVVTVYISKKYSFEATAGGTYSKVGDKVSLAFNIPADFPANLFPVRCYIKAEDLNPDKSSSQKPMLIDHKDNTYYYIYEAEQAGPQTVAFVTTRATVTSPTVSNEYFETATISLEKNIPGLFSNLSIEDAPYEKDGTFELTFEMSKSGAVTIAGDLIQPVVYQGQKGTNRVTVTTTQFNASGNIELRAEGFDSVTSDYSNSDLFGNDYPISGDIYYYDTPGASGSYKVVNASVKYQFVTPSGSYNITSWGKTGTISVANGKYTIVIPAGTRSDDGILWGCLYNGNENKNAFIYQSIAELLEQKTYLKSIHGPIKNGSTDVSKDKAVSCSLGGTVSVYSTGQYVFYPKWTLGLYDSFNFSWKKNTGSGTYYTNTVTIGRMVREMSSTGDYPITSN